MRSASRSIAPVLAGLLAFVVLTLYVFQLREAHRSAARRVGVAIEPTADGVKISELADDGPAAAAGARAGDRLLAIDGFAIRRVDDYDVPAGRFQQGTPVHFELEREGEILSIQVAPGSPVPWLAHLVDGLVILLCLALGLATLTRSNDLRSRLLIAFLFLLALELALPIDTIGMPRLGLAVWTLYLLLAGAQICVELHLASVIPDRQPWLSRHPWVIPSFYLFGGATGLSAAATYLLEEVGGREVFPWSYPGLVDLVGQVAVPGSALLVLLLLGRSALRYPELEGRLQAGLVFLGVFPRAVYLLAEMIFASMGRGVTFELAPIYPLVLAVYPVAVFVAIYRYHLFDVEWVVRRSFLYTGSTTLLILGFYAMIVGGGALFTMTIDAEHSIWLVSAGCLALGLLFGSIRRFVADLLDRRFYPERRAMRRELARLAQELPALGKAPRMGRHLVERLGKIFAAGSVTLLQVEARSGLLLTLASTRGDEEEELLSPSFLLSPEDPGVRYLQNTARPVSLRRFEGRSPVLESRLQRLRAELLVPLIHSNRLVGLLILGKSETSPRYPLEEIELLDLFAHQAASTFENVRLFESATYESLTGLRRREAILELLEQEVDRARRYRRPLSVGFADLDHFKTINDGFGHLAGDAILRQVAHALASGLRRSDAIGRYGGEEFLLIFPETDLEGAITVAEKLRSRIEGLCPVLDDGRSIEVRISIGLAGFDSGARSATALIDAADQALYRAKERGRNRVVGEQVAAGGA